jgi:hypothetical protein
MSKKDEFEDSPKFYITNLEQLPDTDELKVDYQITEEFKAWYKNKHELKRWSRPHFEKSLLQLLREQVKSQLSGAPPQEND